MSMLQFVCTQFECQTVIFDPYIEPNQVLPLQARMDLGALAMKGYSTFPKAPALQEPRHQIVLCHFRTLIVVVLTLGKDTVVVFYSPSRPDWKINNIKY